jgi:hypothetical protein
MITRTELTAWQSYQDYPSVSILAPTHRTAPSNKQDPIKVKNLVNKAIDRIHREFNKREVAAVVRNLKKAVQSVDWKHTLDGLAIFANKDVSAAIDLPFRVKPRAMVDETFATRDLVYAFNRVPPYRVLLLGHDVWLYDGWSDVLDMHLDKPFPIKHSGPGGATKLPGGKGISRSAVRDDSQRKLFRSVDDAVGFVHKQNPLPIVLAGVERNLAFYKEVTRHNDSIVGMLAGNHERTSPTELGKLAWSVFEAGAALRRTEALVQLDQAVSANRHASGIDQVWRVAKRKNCRTLLVEKEFSYPADVSPDGDRLLKHTAKGPDALDDVVDEIIEHVMAAGGEVFFYSSGDLSTHQKIAAILRR